MTEGTGIEAALTKGLGRFVEEGNSMALACLKRGASGSSANMLRLYRFVGWAVERCSFRWDEDVFLMVSSFFALYHQGMSEMKNAPGKNLGAAMHDLAVKKAATENEAIEDVKARLDRRFSAFLTAQGSDLFVHLRYMIRLLGQYEVALDWELLIKDLMKWNLSSKITQRSWAKSFWGVIPE